MALLDYFAGRFDENARRRGMELYRAQNYRMVHGSASSADAYVFDGGETHQVRIQWENRALQNSCDCPRGRAEPCAHMVCVILAAQREGHLSAVEVSLRFRGSGELEVQQDDRPPAAPSYVAPAAGRWRSFLSALQAEDRLRIAKGQPSWPEGREVLYLFHRGETRTRRSLALELYVRDPYVRQEGFKKPQRFSLRRSDLHLVPDEQERRLLHTLAGCSPLIAYMAGEESLIHAQFTLSDATGVALLPEIFATGRAALYDYDPEQTTPLRLHEASDWLLRIHGEHQPGSYRFQPELVLEQEVLPLERGWLALQPGLVLHQGVIYRLSPAVSLRWLRTLDQTALPDVPEREVDSFLEELFGERDTPDLLMPAGFDLGRVQTAPVPVMSFALPEHGPKGRVQPILCFRYQEHQIPADPPGEGRYVTNPRAWLVRDLAGERKARARLIELNVPNNGFIPSHRLPQLVHTLLSEGWEIKFDGQPLRSGRPAEMQVSSGIDWFDLHAAFDFGDGITAEFPDLLEALRRGESVVRLSDGSLGMLPEEWLSRLASFARLGSIEESGRVRFRRNQAALLDLLLEAAPEARLDEAFAKVRAELQSFREIAPLSQPETFVGQLRGYQCEGLGWLAFLDRFGFGGCLADDMGVGKTAQVLALLESRRQRQSGPSLVVVPRSLVFNWRQEAQRFTPRLRVLEYAGPERSLKSLAESDLVVTTYGLMRRDITQLAGIEFDYVILDEAQAIKNSSTDAAKAARLLRGRRRLALSGTPVENHLGELWSLFEFLNPGVLGAASSFQNGLARDPAPETRELLARALRPFILRRTKQQVAKELPPKTEQVLLCELDDEHRELYDELKQHYQATLLGRIDRDGLGRSKMHVLEALLRLRQAACHPGLLDRQRAAVTCAKFDTLLDQIEELREEGHKALVFSQFTSLLALLKPEIEKRGWRYTYLDGRTRDRQARVEEFQNDPECGLFLISLKAGGLGLNLTAAGYVFLLDPWWNPAVEAQAIDRTHRIGQQNPVFAYRLIAKDTVEEKVLELQDRKRELASAIISEDNAILTRMTREDLELLLS